MIRKIHANQTWGIRQEVMWPDESLDYVKIPGDENAIHYGYFIDEELVAVVSVFIDSENRRAQFRKLACLNKHQGKGIGSSLVKHLVTMTAVNRIFCNARIEKTSFYSKLGFEMTEEKFSRKNQQYVVMEKYFNR